MKKFTTILTAAAVVATTVLLSACGGGQEAPKNTSKPADGATSTGKAPEKVKLKVALPSKMFLNLPEYVAQKKGFFEKENLEVEFINIADSSVPIKNLIANEVDLIYTGTSETLAAAAKGAEVKVLGGVNLGLHYGVYVNANSGINKIEDLIGKKVAISSPGSLPHVAALALLNKAGINKKEDLDKITWVPISGSSGRIQGVLSGKVDATLSAYSPDALKDPNMKMLFVVSEQLPDFLMTSLDTSDKALKTKRDAIKRFIKADINAVRYIHEHKDESLAIAKEFVKSDDESLKQYYEFYTTKNVWRLNAQTTADAIKYMEQLNVDNKIQDKMLPPEKVFDGTLVDEVLQEVGKK